MLKSDFLDRYENIMHGVFSPKEGMGSIEKYFKTKKIALLHQIHSTDIFNVSLSNFKDFPDCDGAITRDEGIVLLVKTADCSPIIFYNHENKTIAVVHAGWRGALNGIIKKAVEKIGRKGTIALVGPMIYKDNYEVKNDLMDKFENKDFFMENEGKFYFDFPSFIGSELKESKIDDFKFMGIDTYSNNKTLASHRFNVVHNITKLEHLFTCVMLKGTK